MDTVGRENVLLRFGTEISKEANNIIVAVQKSIAKVQNVFRMFLNVAVTDNKAQGKSRKEIRVNVRGEVKVFLLNWDIVDLL